MNNRLLTLDDLYNFYSKYKKSVKFNAYKNDEPVVVQIGGSLKFEEEKESYIAGLTRCRLQACHTETNLNKSTISYEVMEQKLLPSFKNRPILGFIHTVNGEPCFYGHNAHEENGEIIYDEIAVGNIPETNNATLEYDEENERYNVMIDGYLYDEYTKATEIVNREGECPCSVEISILSMTWNAKDKTLHIEDGYFSGVTILGYDENGKKVKPGMAGSNIKLKDFSQAKNSVLNDLSDIEESKLLEMLNKLNDTLSNFSREPEKGGQPKTDMTKFEELLKKYNKTVEDVDFEYENISDEELEKMFSEKFEKEPDDPDQDPEPKSNPDDKGEPDEPEKNPDDEPKKYTKQFELSHEDIQCALYELLKPLEDTLNEWYWIVNVYDDYFIYSGYGCKFYKQKYTKTGDVVTLDGERLEVFSEFLTEEELNELNNMRKNYSLVTEKLAAYEEAESIADKMTVFNDKAYENYLETKEFKSLMEKENLKKFTKEELSEKADAALGKLVKENKTFSMKFQQKEEKRPSFLAFAKPDTNSSFLDGLLKK